MKRTLIALPLTALLGVALVQGAGASLEIATDPPESIVSVAGPDGFMSMLDLPGARRLEGLSPGRYYIVATAEGYAVAEAEAELSEGTSATVELVLEPAAGVQGTDQQAGRDQDGTDAQQADGTGDQQAAGGSEQAEQQPDQQQAGEGQQADGGVDPQLGAQIYEQQCAQCHGGQGGGGMGPALSGNSNLEDVQMVVGQILHGGGGMPAFAAQLSDEEVAAVASHEMNSWGNQFGRVSPQQVAQQRGGSEAGEQQPAGEE